MSADQQALGMHYPCTDTSGTTSTPGYASPLCGAGDGTQVLMPVPQTLLLSHLLGPGVLPW